jgi:hypothetical protein
LLVVVREAEIVIQTQELAVAAVAVAVIELAR